MTLQQVSQSKAAKNVFYAATSVASAYVCTDGYEGFLFSNQENVRTSPLGNVADFQIVKAPAAFKREVNKWLSLPVRLMQIV